MALKKWLDKLTLLDLFDGLSVTGRHLFKKKVTIQYPEQKKLPSDRFRGMFRLDEERCIKCTLCAIECPINIIYIDWHNEKNAAGQVGEGPRPLRRGPEALHVLPALRGGVPDGAQVDLADDEDLRDGGLRPQRLALPRHPQADRLARGAERQAVHRRRAGMR